MSGMNEHPEASDDCGSPRERIDADYRRWFPLVMRRCLKMLRNEEDALDAAQTVFLNAHRYLKVREDASITLNFYFRSATNTCLNIIMRDYRKRALELPVIPEFPDPGSGSVQRTDAREVVTKALSVLDEATRSIIYYIYWDDMPQEEIAEVMNINRRTVGRKLKRGMLKMQRFINSTMAVKTEV